MQPGQAGLVRDTRAPQEAHAPTLSCGHCKQVPSARRSRGLPAAPSHRCPQIWDGIAPNGTEIWRSMAPWDVLTLCFQEAREVVARYKCVTIGSTFSWGIAHWHAGTG